MIGVFLKSENMADGEQLSWLLVNNIELLVNLCDEAPVFELISSVHRNSAASGLIIQAIATKCAEITDVSKFFCCFFLKEQKCFLANF